MQHRLCLCAVPGKEDVQRDRWFSRRQGMQFLRSQLITRSTYLRVGFGACLDVGRCGCGCNGGVNTSVCVGVGEDVEGSHDATGEKEKVTNVQQLLWKTQAHNDIAQRNKRRMNGSSMMVEA